MGWPALAGIAVSAAILLPLALKWQLPLWVVASWSVVLGGVSGLVLGSLIPSGQAWLWIAAQVSVTVCASAAAAALAFFRDPERTPPGGTGQIVSPADGRVIYVRRVRRGEVPPVEKRGNPLRLTELARIDVCEDGYLVGIAMHLLNVHVNRAPIAGRVSSLVHTPGAFLSLRRDDASSVNERFTTVIENPSMRIAVVQIASRLVRRIVSYLGVGEQVVSGQRIGMIRFGSQVDVIIPEQTGVKVLARPGDKVRAGVSVLATVGPQPEGGTQRGSS